MLGSGSFEIEPLRYRSGYRGSASSGPISGRVITYCAAGLGGEDQVVEAALDQYAVAMQAQSLSIDGWIFPAGVVNQGTTVDE